MKTDVNAPNDFQLGQQNLVFDRLAYGMEKGLINAEGNLARNTLRTARGLRVAAASVSIGLSVYNRHGVLTAGDVVKGAIGVVSTFGPVGWAYTGLDIGVAYFFGTSITDRIGNAVDNAIPNARVRVY